MADEFVFVAELEEEEVIRSLRAIDAEVNRMEGNADARFRGFEAKMGQRFRRVRVVGVRSFKDVGSSAAASSATMGLVAGAAAAITNKILELGATAVRTFSEIIKTSVAIAAQFENVEASFVGIFEGKDDVATAVFDVIKQRSAELGVDLTTTARRFLPMVDSLEQALELGELAARLALFEPVQGVQGALISLQEAAVGDLISLTKRFELPTDQINELQAELGFVEGLIQGLGNELSARGIDFEVLGDTGTLTFNRMRARFLLLQDALGEPVLESLTEQAQFLNDFIDANKEDLNIILTLIGDIVAKIITLTGVQVQGFLEDVNLSALIDNLNNLKTATEGLGIVFEQLGDTYAIYQETFGTGDVFGGAISEIFTLENILKSTVFYLGILNLEFIALQRTLVGVAALGKAIQEGHIRSLDDLKTAMSVISSDIQEGLHDSALATIRRVGELEQVFANSAQSSEELAEAQEKETEAALQTADAILQLNQAEKNLAEAQRNLAEETAKTTEKLNELYQDAAFKREDAAIKLARKLLDIEEDAAQKRIDILRKNLQRVEDIYTKNNERIFDSRLDLARDLQDILRDAGRAQIDIDAETAKKRLEIEEDFRERLAEIRRRFDFQAEEAIRANDAVALRRIRRRMEFELNEARIARDQEIEEEDQSADERREKERIDNERRIEDARIANQRRLKDLQVALERELQERRVALARELADATLAEKRKREEARKTFDENIEDIQRGMARQVQALRDGLEAEIQILRQAEAEKLRVINESTQRIFAARAAQMRALASLSRALGNLRGMGVPGIPGISTLPGGGGVPVDPFGQNGRIGGRQLGGPVRANEPVLVGEPLPGGRPNPEIFIPASSGNIIPLNRMLFSPSSAPTLGSSISETNMSVELPHTVGLTPIEVAEVKSIAMSIGTELILRATRR